MEFRSGL
jgi:sodium/potassium-transporting ATPase subunit alpha